MHEQSHQNGDKRGPRGAALESRLHALIVPVVEAGGFELIELRLLRGPRGATRLQLFIDSPPGGGGVLVDDCASVSRKVGAMLEVDDPMPGAYDLEVSSPGMKRLLRHADDVRRFLGVRARLTLPETPEGPRRTLIGELSACEGEDVTITLDGGATETLAFSALQRATLDPTLDQWQALGEQQRAERMARDGDQTDDSSGDGA